MVVVLFSCYLFSGLFMPSVVMLERAHLVARVSSQCIDGKTVFFKSLGEKGIFRIGDLISDNNELITTCNLRDLDLTPLDVFRVVSVINALPNEWRCKLKE